MTATSFHNSCLNMESGTVEVFCETGDVCESGEYCHSRHDTMPCSVTTSPMPDSFFVDKEGIYLFAASDVPTSSLQSLSFLFHLASHVGSFPAIRQILLPFPRTVFWNSLLESAQSLLPATARFRILWSEELKQLGGSVCYQSLVTITMENDAQTTVSGLRWTNDGGAFLHQRDVDSLRAAVYKAQNVGMTGRGFKFVRVLFATTRVPEMEEIREYYKKNGVRSGERSEW